MLNFHFYNPTRIIFGKNTISKLERVVPKGAHVLILYGGSSAEKNGTLDEVKKALGLRNISLFGGIEANPSYETLIKAVEQVKQNNIDFLLAVGGGSVIDGTKFIAAAVDSVNFVNDPWEILETGGANLKTAMPFGTVLTLPATGSEMNSFSVVSRKEIKSKLSFKNELVFPQFSILDPVKTYTLPTAQVANGVVDSFVHITEQYLTYPAQAMVQDKFSEGLLQILIEIGHKLLQEPENYELHANFMWVATLGLNGLIGAGAPQDWAAHAIGHELTALYGIDHARTLAIILPSLWQVKKQDKKEKLLQYAERVWSIHSGTDEQKIDEAIEKTRVFFESLGIKTRLSDYGVAKQEIDKIVSQLERHGMTALGEKQDITLEVSKQILERSL